MGLSAGKGRAGSSPGANEGMEKHLGMEGTPHPEALPVAESLRQQNPNPPMAVKTKEELLIGPRPTLQAIGDYWEGIMCRDPGERRELEEWLALQRPRKVCPEDSSRDDALFQVVKLLKRGVAPGLDGWPSEALRLLPREAMPALRYLYDTCAAWKCWPHSNMLVRTHMLAKELDVGELNPSAADWRPIALTSLWMRIWSKWQLILIPEPLLNTFATTLTGGLPGRSPRGSMLKYLLNLEETNDVPSE